MERHDPEAIEGDHVSQELPFLESPEAVEHTHADSRARYSSDEDTSIWGPGLNDTSDEDTSIQGLEAVDTHGLSDTMIQADIGKQPKLQDIQGSAVVLVMLERVWLTISVRRHFYVGTQTTCQVL